MFSKSLALFALVATPAFANVFLTSPTAASTFAAGQEATISWQDDNVAPLLAQFGNAKVSIYVGNAQQQTMLQPITDSVNVATTSSIKFTPSASIGPNSNQYFIRVESLQAKDPGNPQFPALSFSAKFTMTGMTGNFSPVVQAQIDGQTSAPLGAAPATSRPASPATTAAATTTSRPAATTSASRSSTPAASATGTTGGALKTSTTGWVSVILSVIVAAAAF